MSAFQTQVNSRHQSTRSCHRVKQMTTFIRCNYARSPFHRFNRVLLYFCSTRISGSKVVHLGAPGCQYRGSLDCQELLPHRVCGKHAQRSFLSERYKQQPCQFFVLRIGATWPCGVRVRVKRVSGRRIDTPRLPTTTEYNAKYVCAALTVNNGYKHHIAHISARRSPLPFHPSTRSARNRTSTIMRYPK